MDREFWSYLAGFLDGDGSIYVRLKPNQTYRYRFQVAPSVVLYQSMKGKKFLADLQLTIGRGYLRDRKDQIVEYVIEDSESILFMLNEMIPYLRLKRDQAVLMTEIIENKKTVASAENFLELAGKVDRFRDLNYSKRRTCDSEKVKDVLKREGLLTP